MIRFGLHLTLRSGREGLARLVVIAMSVAVGVGLLLSTLALYHAYHEAIAKPCWQCTDSADPHGSLLWNYGEDEFEGHLVQRLDVATLSARTPVVPGLTAMPAPGRYYASPALAALLRTTPADELGARFPGTLAGVIGPAGLQGPDDLAVVVGRPATDLVHLPHTIRVAAIDQAPRGLSASTFYRLGFGLGAIALLVPMLVLIGNATRIAAARREERYAAMRLVGAERGQISVIASVDAVAGAVIGAVAGVGLYAALRPGLTHLSLLGYRFFDDSITPTTWGYVGALVAVPAAAALVSVMSLRRVRISPLGVVRRTAPPPPRLWRLLPLAIGLAVFVVPALTAPKPSGGAPGLAFLALVLVMTGMMVAGPWLTLVSAKLLARWPLRGSGLLAARRLADNPRAAFRAVSGIVLAVMVGTALAALVPAALASQDTTRTSPLRDVLRVGFSVGDQGDPGPGYAAGLPAGSASALLAKLSTIPGATPVPLYVAAGSPAPDPAKGAPPDEGDVVRCADVATMPALGRCPVGATAVQVDVNPMYTDNLRALNDYLPFVRPDSPVVAAHGELLLSDLLVGASSPAALERVRTALSGYRQDIDPNETPLTFGEVAAVRARLYLELQRVVSIVAGVTLVVAGSGLAVAISGSLVERKRPFTVLRVAGTDLRTLYRAVLLETVLPLLAATIVAAGVGLAVAWPIARALAPTRHAAVLPHAGYALTLGGGVLASVVIIAACLPLLGRITATQNVRFE